MSGSIPLYYPLNPKPQNLNSWLRPLTYDSGRAYAPLTSMAQADIPEPCLSTATDTVAPTIGPVPDPLLYGTSTGPLILSGQRASLPERLSEGACQGLVQTSGTLLDGPPKDFQNDPAKEPQAKSISEAQPPTKPPSTFLDTVRLQDKAVAVSPRLLPEPFETRS